MHDALASMPNNIGLAALRRLLLAHLANVGCSRSMCCSGARVGFVLS